MEFATIYDVCVGSVRLFKLTREMLNAIEEWMKQDDETTATQLVKMLGERSFKIPMHTVDGARKTLGWTLTLPTTSWSPLMFFSLLGADSRYSTLSYLDNQLPPYLIRIFSTIPWGTAIECNCSDKRVNSNTSTVTIFCEVRCSYHPEFHMYNYILNNIITVNR